MNWKCVVPLLATAILMSCASHPPLDAFAGSTPAFDPVKFFTGHTHSWGVEEDRSGAPEWIVVTDCLGNAEGPDGLHMVQHLTMPNGS
ncbi:MAG TPA: DUF3833 family protein [Stellaceae bacterium]|nr:DUF3833 family protein [Stellaceae bacterium]